MGYFDWLAKLPGLRGRRDQPGVLNLSGDREIEWSFVAGHIPDAGSQALDFGCGNAPLGLAAALKGYNVLAIDLGSVHWAFDSPGISFVQGDVNKHDFGGRLFDVILNCSTVEHVGLAGRYGILSDADGDLKAMARLRQILAPTGRMILTVPIGQDRVCRPYHRIYGPARLPRLLSGYRQNHAEYWAKRSGRNVWVPVQQDEAFAVAGGPAFYALGLFVLSSGYGRNARSAI